MIGLLILCGAVYLLAFFLPVTPELAGYQTFGLAAIYPALWPAWAANPVFLWAVFKAANQEFETAAMLAAIASALGFLSVLPIREVPDLGPGYWLWIAAPTILAIGSVKLAKVAERQLVAREAATSTSLPARASRSPAAARSAPASSWPD